MGVFTLQGTVVDYCNMCSHCHGKSKPSYLEPRQHCFWGSRLGEFSNVILDERSFKCRLVKG